MVAKSDMSRIEFNEIEAAGEYAYQIGQLLSSYLGKMKIKVNNYYPDGVVSEGIVYQIKVGTIQETGLPLVQSYTEEYDANSTLDFTIEYTATATDTLDEVMLGLSQWVTDNASERLSTEVFIDYTSDVDKYMVIIPNESYHFSEISKSNMASDDTQVWTNSTTPASYAAYGKHPQSSLPRIIVTPIAEDTVCQLMEDSTEIVDDVLREFTSTYLNYSMNVTCEAGDTSTVLQTKISARNILNRLKKSMGNEIIRKTMQNNLNSVCYPIKTITSIPAMAQTQYMDMANCIADFSCIDVFYPEVGAGFIETVVVATPPLEEGDPESGYKYTEDSEWVLEAEESTITIQDVEDFISY